MKVERFDVAGLAQYAYMVSGGGMAAVIDPARDVERYVAYAAEHGLRITHVLETHIHADFASGGAELAKRTGAELAVSGYDRGEMYEYAMPHRALRDLDELVVGCVRLRVLHTPGHTPEHVSFVALDTTRNATEPVALFSGDFLFVGSVGRPDLLGEEAKRGLAGELYRSMHGRIAGLKDGVLLYPGHGAGSFCGSGMSERPESTLGYERAANPLFRLGEQELVETILGSVPAMPSYYPRMKRLNAAGAESWPMATEVPGLSADAVRTLTAEADVVVLDVRRAEGFGGAHVPGAVNIGAGATLPLWAGWVLDASKRVAVVGDGTLEEAEEVRLALGRVGIDGVAGYLKGGMAAWLGAGFAIARTPQVATGEIDAGTDGAVLVDVRNDLEWRSGHIAGAVHVPVGELAGRMGELPGGRPVIAVCGSGYRSSLAASLLERGGFTGVGSLAGGMLAWRRRGLEVVGG